MTALALVVVLWLAVLVPPAVKRHKERRQEFLDSFQKGLGALGAAAPAAAVFDVDAGRPPAPAAASGRPAPDRASAAQRRRTIFALLLASMAIAAVPAVVMGGKSTLAVFLAVSDCFLAYLGLVVRWRDTRASTLRPATVGPVARPEPLWDDDEPLVVSPATVRAVLRAG